MIDSQVEAYNDEVDNWARQKKNMEKVIKKSMDAEAQQSASEQKANMKEAHDKKLHAIARTIAGVDSALMTLRPEKDWKEQDVKAIYEDYPELKPSSKSAAMLATKSRRVSKE